MRGPLAPITRTYHKSAKWPPPATGPATQTRSQIAHPSSSYGGSVAILELPQDANY